MKIIPRKIHGTLDYSIGVALIFAPYLLGFAHTGAASSSAIACGIILIVYSAFTDYEAGIVKLLPFRAHLLFDFILGAALALSPWYLHYFDWIWIPHVVVGVLAMIIPFLSQSRGYRIELPADKNI